MPPSVRAAIGQATDSLYSPGADLADRSQAADAPTAAAKPAAPAGARLGFGCAGLMRSPSARHRQRLLGEAFEQGITHFDVARMYGLGAAEHELGQFARGRREQLTIATKFGIEPGGAAGRLAPLQAPARALLACFPAARRAVKRRADNFHQPGRYDPASARASLQRSLRELDTDYVDIFFIHGPASGDELEMTALAETLEDMRAAGHLHAWGLAGDARPCVALSELVDPPALLQIRDNIFEQTLPPFRGGRPAITFGVLVPALQRILAHVWSTPERRARWSAAVGEDCGRPEVLASLLLQDALTRNRAGTVLFSTTRPERMRIATAAEELTRTADPARLRSFQELVADELTREDAGAEAAQGDAHA